MANFVKWPRQLLVSVGAVAAKAEIPVSYLTSSTNQDNDQRLITSTDDSHKVLDYDDDFRSGCRNVSLCHHKQPFSEVHSPGTIRLDRLTCNYNIRYNYICLSM